MKIAKIERGIKLPALNNKKHRVYKYPFWQMKVGDSLAMDCAINSACTIVGYWKRATKRKFTVRSMGAKKCRVWRVE